jgi:hypothetical protein
LWSAIYILKIDAITAPFLIFFKEIRKRSQESLLCTLKKEDYGDHGRFPHSLLQAPNDKADKRYFPTK